MSQYDNIQIIRNRTYNNAFLKTHTTSLAAPLKVVMSSFIFKVLVKISSISDSKSQKTNDIPI